MFLLALTVLGLSHVASGASALRNRFGHEYPPPTNDAINDVNDEVSKDIKKVKDLSDLVEQFKKTLSRIDLDSVLNALATFVSFGLPAIAAFLILSPPKKPTATLTSAGTATITTTAASDKPTPHIIAPSIGVSLAEEKRFIQQLNDDVGEANVQTIIKPDSHVCIWYVPLTPPLILKYKQDPIVRQASQPLAASLPVLTSSRSKQLSWTVW
jgi:hypothetical protein